MKSWSKMAGATYSVDEALDAILSRITPLDLETVELPDALGRVLAHSIMSSENLPPFDNSAMDGFAVHAKDTEGAASHNPIHLKIAMDIPAGSAPPRELYRGEAARIMTGAPLPAGADAVIAVEQTNADFTLPIHHQHEVLIYSAAQPGTNLRYVGENISAGQTILKEEVMLRPPDIGVLASLGITEVPVWRRPRAVVIGSGDEIIEPNVPLAPGKIRDSNSFTLQALVREDGGEAHRLPPVGDTPDDLRHLFRAALDLAPDVIISSAGVSVGAADHVRNVVSEIGRIELWRINMRPGKPLAFGHIRNIPFFGLPGNPVSAMVTYDVVVRPALLKMGHRRDCSRYVTAIAGESMHSDGRRTYTRVTLKQIDNNWLAFETGTQSSGAHMSMVIADALLIIPENIKTIEQGTAVRVKLLKEIEAIDGNP